MVLISGFVRPFVLSCLEVQPADHFKGCNRGGAGIMLYHCPSLVPDSATPCIYPEDLTIQTHTCNFISLLTSWKKLFLCLKSNSLLFPLRNGNCGDENILLSPSQLRYLKVNSAKHLLELFWRDWISGWRAIREEGFRIPRMLWTLVPTQQFKMTDAFWVQVSMSSLYHRGGGTIVMSAAVMRCLLWSSLLNGLTWAFPQPGFGLNKEPKG